VKRDDVVTASSLARHTDVPDYAANAASAHENPSTVHPDLVKFAEELFVVLEIAELPLTVSSIVLKRPVRRRRDDQVHG
jgi:hypothetical protein